MHHAFMFYVDIEWEGWKKIKVGILLGSKPVSVGLQETNNF